MLKYGNDVSQKILGFAPRRWRFSTCHWHRFSAFWLRSKCSICSYQLNIWYSPHCGLRILNWFLPDRLKAWACSASVAGCYSIALPLYCSLFKKIINYLTLIFLNDPPFCLNLYLFSWPCQIFCSFCTMPWVWIRKISFTYYSLLDSHQDNERGKFCGKCRYLTLPFHCSWPKLVVRSQSLNKLVLAQDMWALISLTYLSWSNYLPPSFDHDSKVVGIASRPFG